MMKKDTTTTTLLVKQPTSKDFLFYGKYYTQTLQKQYDETNRWKEFTTRRMDNLGHEPEIYSYQEKVLMKYVEKLATIQEQLSQPLDTTNEEFLVYVQEQLVIKERQVQNSKKKKEEVQLKKQKEKDVMKSFYASESQFRRSQRTSQRDMNFFYEKMMKIDMEMPQYMKDTLDKMPSNKGYIYRGVWYFGHVPVSPREEKYLTMFERIKGIQYIHEYIHEFPVKTYNLYEKLSKTSPKKLIVHEIYEMR